MCFSICAAALMYVITGGPSSGKTSIIKELEKRGEAVIHEAAVDCIIKGMSLGICEPWKEKQFALDILNLQLERENPYLLLNGRVFIDRGLFDGYAYVKGYGIVGTRVLADLNKTLNSIDLNERYKAIFFIPPYQEENFSSLQTELRRENTQEAVELDVATYAIYCRHNRFIVVPGNLSPQERADFILENVRQIDESIDLQGSLQ